ncbi:MAG: glycosyltransferase family 9 protein [Fidelibacterota bacterium]
MEVDKLKRDCRHFRGEIPCVPHKRMGVHCDGCPEYDPVKQKILIIKLGAIGDVIRTTPLLRRLKSEYPSSLIFWITKTPEVIPSGVDRIFGWSFDAVMALEQMEFYILINLDKDLEAAALADRVRAREKKGFTLNSWYCYPANVEAEHKYLTGIFDDINRANRKSYLEEIFEICGFKFNKERYILTSFSDKGYVWNIAEPHPLIGLNTGCGGRWRSRLWPEPYWRELAVRLREAGYGVVLLGGELEHRKNVRLSRVTGAAYPGYFTLTQFINLVDQCELVVTAVTMALHIAIGLSKKVVLFNNIFNPHEFELYGLGEILEPDFECDCFFSPECPNNCMQYLSVDRVYNSCVKLLHG